MYKIILIFTLLFVNIVSIDTEEQWSSILRNLSVKEREINLKVKTNSNNCFNLMKKKQNFLLENKKCIYIKSYKEFSIFQIIDPAELIQEKSKLVESVQNMALLFDHKKELLFLIKYDRNRSVTDYISTNKIKLSSSFFYHISSIIKLDNTFEPTSALEFYTMPPSLNQKEGDLAYRIVFFIIDDCLQYKRINSEDENLNINNLNYTTILDMFSIKANSTDLNNIDKINVKRENLFSSNEPYL